MVTGGMLLEDLPPEDRKKAGLTETEMALRVKYPGGGTGPAAAALKAGVRQGDVVVSFDERTDFHRESDWFAYALFNRKIGDQEKLTEPKFDNGKEHPP